VLHCLEKHPARRLSTADAFRERLSEAARAAHARPQSVPKGAASSRIRSIRNDRSRNDG
jgi:hypothetical protein